MKILTFMFRRDLWKLPSIHVLRQLNQPQEVFWIEDMQFDIPLKYGRKTLRALSVLPRLPKNVGRFRNCDIIFVASDFWAEVLAFIVAKLHHKRYVIRMRGNPFISRKIISSRRPPIIRLLYAIYNKVEAFLFRHASLIITSIYGFEQYVKNRNLNSNVVTLYNAMEDWIRFGKQEGPNSNNIIFGYLGRLSPEKGVKELFDAVNNLPVKLVLYARLDWQIAFPENVEYKGFLPHEQVLEAYRNIDVLVLPSYTEGAARTLMEAMFLGKAVIVTPVGDNKLFVDEKGGWVCTLKDLRATILEASKKTKKEILEMGRYNQQKAHSLWGSWQEYSEKLLSTLKKQL